MDQSEKKIRWEKFDGKIVYKIPSGVKKAILRIFVFDGKLVGK